MTRTFGTLVICNKIKCLEIFNLKYVENVNRLYPSRKLLKKLKIHIMTLYDGIIMKI